MKKPVNGKLKTGAVPSAQNGSSPNNQISDPPSKIAVQDDYSIEDVASIAAQLLKGQHHNHCIEAAKQALELLDVCRHELNVRKRHKEIREKAHRRREDFIEKYCPAGDRHISHLSWPEALKHITSKRKLTDAQPLFKRFLAHNWQKGRAIAADKPFDKVAPPTIKQIDDRVAKYNAGGMSGALATQYKYDFEEWGHHRKSEEAREKGRKGGIAKAKKKLGGK